MQRRSFLKSISLAIAAPAIQKKDNVPAGDRNVSDIFVVNGHIFLNVQNQIEGRNVPVILVNDYDSDVILQWYRQPAIDGSVFENRPVSRQAYEPDGNSRLMREFRYKDFKSHPRDTFFFDYIMPDDVYERHVEQWKEYCDMYEDPDDEPGVPSNKIPIGLDITRIRNGMSDQYIPYFNRW